VNGRDCICVNAIVPGVFPTDLNPNLLEGTDHGREILMRTGNLLLLTVAISLQESIHESCHRDRWVSRSPDFGVTDFDKDMPCSVSWCPLENNCCERRRSDSGATSSCSRGVAVRAVRQRQFSNSCLFMNRTASIVMVPT
jgi:hypothetical protein